MRIPPEFNPKRASLLTTVFLLLLGIAAVAVLAGAIGIVLGAVSLFGIFH